MEQRIAELGKALAAGGPGGLSAEQRKKLKKKLKKHKQKAPQSTETCVFVFKGKKQRGIRKKVPPRVSLSPSLDKKSSREGASRRRLSAVVVLYIREK